MEPLPICNGSGKLQFIYSKYIYKCNEYLEQISKRVPIVDTEIVLETEVYYTSKIEGSKTTRIRTTEIHNGSAIREDEVYSECMVRNCFDAVKLLKLYGVELTEKKLVHVWNTLTKDCCDKIDKERMG